MGRHVEGNGRPQGTPLRVQGEWVPASAGTTERGRRDEGIREGNEILRLRCAALRMTCGGTLGVQNDRMGSAEWEACRSGVFGRSMAGGLLEGEGGLEPLAGVVDFQGCHPLDPLVAAAAGGHEPEGEAVSMGQCFVADGGGE